ncbi:hypothetical protein MES4922_500008 [Mesorhizobium ventifaucium]|uniref:Uncharacterized protein n=1 Tax=Mesorhizobium ventifaucium TaxID=666020 RepID=A0ABM9EB47_9HYPH|nr:hypothetical protein MES4922_500008 [Mesorhizobium ventifaucium]
MFDRGSVVAQPVDQFLRLFARYAGPHARGSTVKTSELATSRVTMLEVLVAHKTGRWNCSRSDLLGEQTSGPLESQVSTGLQTETRKTLISW